MVHLFYAATDFDPLKDMPTFAELVTYYGPWLTLILILVIGMLFLQNHLLMKVVRAKDLEIKRITERETELNERILTMIDKEIGLKKTIKSA